MSRHSLLGGDENAHVPYRQVFANDGERTGDSGPYTAADLYKKAYQVDSNAEYVLTAITPTWTAVGGGGGGPLGTYWSDGVAFSKGVTALGSGETGHQLFSLDVGGAMSNNDFLNVECRVHAGSAALLDTDLLNVHAKKDNSGVLSLVLSGGARYDGTIMDLSGGAFSGNLLQPEVDEQGAVAWQYTLQCVYRIWPSGLTL